MFRFYVLVYYLTTVLGLPTGYVKTVAESQNFDVFENSLPKYDDLPHYHFSTNDIEDDDLLLRANFKETRKEDVKHKTIQENSTSIDTDILTTNFPDDAENTTFFDGITTPRDSSQDNSSLNQVEPIVKLVETNGTTRLPRQEINETKSDPEFESQEEEDSSEETGNMLTGLLSTFLAGFSRPDGSIDLDAIVGLLGSLSSQNEDGTYDFQGLTDLLRAFFGGGGDGGGGSDVGAFAGGLVGAIVKGLANPPGAKGAGIFTGKIVAGILPALSGPAPPTEDEAEIKPPPEGLDSGGFLAGLIKTVLGSSSGGSQSEGGGSKFNIFKIIFSSITSLFSASSKPNW